MRLNHRNLHKQLEEMGYEVYKLDYSQGNHYFQIEKKSEWHEYKVVTKTKVKKVYLGGVAEPLRELIAEYYKEQNVEVTYD